MDYSLLNPAYKKVEKVTAPKHVTEIIWNRDGSVTCLSVDAHWRLDTRNFFQVLAFVKICKQPAHVVYA
jgi:hypothetical protein